MCPQSLFKDIYYRTGGVTGSGNIYYGRSQPPEGGFYSFIRGLTSSSGNLGSHYRGTVLPRISSRTEENNYIYVALPGGGYGYVSTSLTPDLDATIFGEFLSLELTANYEAETGFTSDHTENWEYIYVALPGGGVGFTISTTKPDLYATIFGEYPYQNLGAGISGAIQGDLGGFIRPMLSGSSDLSSYYHVLSSGYADLYPSISGWDTLDLSASIRAAQPGSGYFSSFYQTLQPASGDLQGLVHGVASGQVDQEAFYRALFSGYADLDSFIEPIPPVDLIGSINGMVAVDLWATLDSVQPIDLGASISGRQFVSLGAFIDGFQSEDFLATITGLVPRNLYVIISGVDHQEEDLKAEINTEDLYRLFCTISGYGTASGDLGGVVEAVPPLDISAFYEAVGPLDIGAVISGFGQGESLEASISGFLDDTMLGAVITSTGGYNDLFVMVRKAEADDEDLLVSVEGWGNDYLTAEINNDPSLLLTAEYSVQPLPHYKDLGGNIIGGQVNDLTVTYIGIDPPTFGASITPIVGPTLQAAIYPSVVNIDVFVPISTFAVDNLYAMINASDCEPSSDTAELTASITPIFADDVGAEIIGAHNWVKVFDVLPIRFGKPAVLKDWIPIHLNTSKVFTSWLPITFMTGPNAQLMASVVGIEAHDELTASITPDFFSSYITSDPASCIWYNLETGEQKIVRILFKSVGSVYYYSPDSADAFPENLKDKVEITVESYVEPDIDPDEGRTLLAQKRDVKRCKVGKLSEFETIDDAIKFAIVCALGDVPRDLSASITAVGQSEILGGKITPFAGPYDDLNASIGPVSNLPLLDAYVMSTGGYSDMNAYIVGVSSDHTETNVESIFGEAEIPISVVFGNNTPQIVLKKVSGLVTIVTGSKPDLSAKITGVAQQDLSVTISGA